MAAIKLYGSSISNATQRALVCLNEKELEYEFVKVNMAAGDHKKEPFLSINPFGQVPALEHGDLKLFESRAITQHIAHENQEKGTDLLCKGKLMPVLSVWLEVESHKFEPASSKLTWELVYKPMFGLTADQAIVEENEDKLAKVLDVYEKRLFQSKYLACDCFTLVDLHHLPNVELLLGTQSKKLFDERPHVSAWAANITARPAWAKVLALQKP